VDKVVFSDQNSPVSYGCINPLLPALIPPKTPLYFMSLKGLTGAVFGFANPKSIAWGIAEAWNSAGASVCIGIQSGRFAKGVAAATASWASPPLVFECDVTDDASVAAAFAAISQHTSGRLNFLAHSLAFAPAPAMQGSLLSTTRGDFATAHAISAYSLLSLTRGALPLMQASGGGSVVALSYIGSQRAARNYCVMGPAKASLEACARGLAAELGTQGIRVNVISPGPINTLAARGISNFHVSQINFIQPSC